MFEDLTSSQWEEKLKINGLALQSREQKAHYFSGGMNASCFLMSLNSFYKKRDENRHDLKQKVI